MFIDLFDYLYKDEKKVNVGTLNENEEENLDPEDFLFKNNPFLEFGGIVHQAHKPENVLLVWWFNPSTAEFIKSNNPKHLHAYDYKNKVNRAEEKEWVRGRVFKSDNRVFLIIYNLKGMSEVLRWDLLAKVSDAIEPNVVSAIINPEGEDISNLFEGIRNLVSSKTGYWKVKDGILIDSN